MCKKLLSFMLMMIALCITFSGCSKQALPVHTDSPVLNIDNLTVLIWPYANAGNIENNTKKIQQYLETCK